MNTLYCRHAAVELQCQFVVPSEVSLLTVLDFYTILLVNLRRALIDCEGHFLCVLGFLCGDVVHHQAASLSTYCGV